MVAGKTEGAALESDMRSVAQQELAAIFAPITHLFHVFPGLGGIIGLLAAWLAVGHMAGTRDIRKWWCGADGRPSTSKFQLVLWTIVVMFVFSTFATLYLAHAKPFESDRCATGGFPQNILIVLGLSGATAVAAKGITTSQVSSGATAKADASTLPGTPAGGLATSDSGGADLSKLQMVAWTVISIGIYFIQFLQKLWTLEPEFSPACDVPDIDSAFMVLMGLSQATYVGKKMVTQETPRINGITPAFGPSGTVVTISGAGFGAQQTGNVVSIDGIDAGVLATTWNDTTVSFTLPAKIGEASLTSGRHEIGLIVNGRSSAGNRPFVVIAADPPAGMVAAAAGGKPMKLKGIGFGTTAGALLINGINVATTSWHDEEIAFALPANDPKTKAAWAAGPMTITATNAAGVNVGSVTVTLA